MPYATLKFGAAYRDITPAYPVWLAGYGGRKERSRGVSEPIIAGVLAVQSGEQAPVLIVTLDVVGVPDVPQRDLRGRIAAATGVPEQAILIACSHTHYAPSLWVQRLSAPVLGLNEPDTAYREELWAAVVSCATEGLQRLRPGRVEIMRTRVPQVHFNRRPRLPDGSVQSNLVYPADEAVAADLTFTATDDELVALRFIGDDTDAAGAMLVNFACHPVTGDHLGDRQSLLVSADWVHYLRAELGAEFGCPAFFLQGAAGDVVPLRRLGKSRRWIGATLAHAVLLGERTFRPLPVDAVEVAWDELEERTRTPTAEIDTEARLDAATARLRALTESGGASEVGLPERAQAAGAWDQALQFAYKARRWPGDRFTVAIQYLRLGPVTLVALPFEVLAELALEMKRSDPHAVLVAYANGYEGYLPFEHDLARGGYEALDRSAHMAPGSAERILARIRSRLESWRRQPNRRGTG